MKLLVLRNNVNQVTDCGTNAGGCQTECELGL